MVMLEVMHASKDLADKDPELGPTWSERSLETRVVVKDQQTVVIGGLMQEREIANVTKVPILGDIPVLGHLFKYTSKIKKKTNLVILLTPYIIRDQSELDQIRMRELRQYDELVRSFHELAAMKYEPKIDYRKKRGLVEEINRAMQGVDEDVAARAKLDTRRRVDTGPVQLPLQADQR
jgi:general secretion pathway protein D